jgi:hypothetical protein
MNRPWAGTLAILAVAALATGCGSRRRFGDADGTPVLFQVKVERAFFDAMRNRSWSPSVGAGAGFSNRGYSGLGLGLGLGYSTTSVFLLGGDAVGQGNVFRKELRWGENSFSVPLRAGRTLALMVQAEGGRSGWEGLGSITVPSDAAPGVRIVMDADGGKVTPTAAVGSPAPAKP